MKRFFSLLTFCFFALTLPFLLQRLTLGFHPLKLCPRIPFHPEWEVAPLKEEEKAKTEAILNQTFTYFGLGSQCYVFKSEDDAYVLKLFRYNRSQFSWIHSLKRWIHRNDPKRVKVNLFTKMEKTFPAFKAAYTDVPECTELVYLQLNPNRNDDTPLHLLDPIGRTWELPRGCYRFAVQKKASPLKLALSQTYDLKNKEATKNLLNSFISLLMNRVNKQICNTDHNLWPNFGSLNGKVIEIDCGNYRKLETPMNQKMKIAEIKKFATPLYFWLQEKEPEFAPYFRERLQEAYQKIQATESR